MKKTIFTLFILSMATIFSFAAHLSPSLQVNARCNGGNEIPAVNSDGYGLAIVTVAQDRRSAQLIFQASGLSGAITGIHIHEAAPSANGGVVYNLTSFLVNNTLDVKLMDTIGFSISKLIAGDYYLNVHTELNPGGEIRGQFNLETDILMGGMLSGDNEIPAVTTMATGYVTSALSSGGQELIINAHFEGLSSAIVGGHLHNAASGSNGGVVFDLSDDIVDNSISVTIDPTSFLDELKAGNIYLNIHTADNAGGELRAQLTMIDGINFDCILSGDNEVPAVVSNTKGVINFSYDHMTNTINYTGFVGATTSTIIGAHLHTGVVGMNGGVIANVSAEVTNGNFSGSIPFVSTQLLNSLLSGGIYLNIHTENNPSGEIRGQVTRLAREGYLCQFTGDQQVPSNTSTSTGVGMVSINRDQSNAHFMMVMDDISDEFQAAHFHDGGPGMNGDVLFNITPFFVDGRAAFGYWYDMGDAAIKFRTTGVYSNNHTTTYPGGELRGNYIRGSFTQANDYSSVRSYLFVSSNVQANMGVYSIDYTNGNTLYTFPSKALDADGIYFDKANDVVYQLNRTENAIDVYEGVIENLIEGDYPLASYSSTSDFINGREIAVSNSKLIVAQDASDDNGNTNKLYVYNKQDGSIALEKTYEVAFNLWGIHITGTTLWAIEDNSNKVAWIEDIFDLDEGMITMSGEVTVENLIRTHGITYDAAEDLMILTDVGSGSSPTDGALVVIENFSDAATDGNISMDEQSRVEGMMSQLGNPVDVAYDFNTSMIYVAERANQGGKILGFVKPTTSGDQAPMWSEMYAGASAVYFNSKRDANQYIPFDPLFDGRLLFTGRLSGGQEVPAVTTDATGVVGILLSEDRTMAKINLSINGLSGEFGGVHLHEAAAGSNGDVILNLTDDFLNNRISTEIMMTPELLGKLMNGMVYINVHSTASPSGEIRSQVLLEKDLSFVNWINGDQEVPSVNTEASGLMSCNLTQVLNTLEINALFKGLSSHITGAHLHNAAMGDNGGVVANLSDMVNDNMISGTVDASSFIDELKAGNIYLNIHTEDNPSGEIRAQLNEWTGINADGWLAGEQTVPQNAVPGLGLMAINLSPDMGTMTVWAVSDDLSDDLSAAHLHLGDQGDNGGVWVNLTEDITNGNIMSTSTDFDMNNVLDLLQGGVYLNMHTSTYPAGEIRGQAYGLIRDAYNYSICQDQEVGSVSNAENANGGGILSMDRKGTNLHLMAVASGLSGEITGAHIHNAPMNSDGGVILNLTPNLINGGIFLYNTSDDFDTNIASKVRSMETYLNFHTAVNPAGEIRGQIIKDLICPIATSNEEVTLTESQFSVSPNPSRDLININISADIDIRKIEMRNGTGQLVLSITPNQTTEFSIKDLAPGIYYISLQTQNSFTIRKVVKI